MTGQNARGSSNGTSLVKGAACPESADNDHDNDGTRPSTACKTASPAPRNVSSTQTRAFEATSRREATPIRPRTGGGAAQRATACAINGTVTPTAFPPRAIDMTPQGRGGAPLQARPCTVESAAPPNDHTHSPPGQPLGTQPPSPPTTNLRDNNTTPPNWFATALNTSALTTLASTSRVTIPPQPDAADAPSTRIGQAFHEKGGSSGTAASPTWLATPPAEGFEAPVPTNIMTSPDPTTTPNKIVTSRTSDVNAPSITCTYTASASTPTTSSPPSTWPSPPKFIDTDTINLLTTTNEGSDTAGGDAVDSEYAVRAPLLTQITLPYTYEKTIVVTSPASETLFYTNTPSLFAITNPTDIMTSRASEVSILPTTCLNTAFSSTSTLPTSSPPMWPSPPTSIDAEMKPLTIKYEGHRAQRNETSADRYTAPKSIITITIPKSIPRPKEVSNPPTNYINESLDQKRFPTQNYFLPVSTHNTTHERPDSTYNNVNDTIATKLAADNTTSDARHTICNDNDNTKSYQESSSAPPPFDTLAYHKEHTNSLPAPPSYQALAYQQSEQPPLSTQNYMHCMQLICGPRIRDLHKDQEGMVYASPKAPPLVRAVALQTTEQTSSLTSTAGSLDFQTTPLTVRLAGVQSLDPDYPQRYPEAQRQRISPSNRKKNSNQLQPENFLQQTYGHIEHSNYQLECQLPVSEKSSSSNHTASTRSGSTTSISSTTNESYTYNPITKIFLLVAVLILRVLLLCNSTTTPAEYSEFSNSIELKETFTSFYQQVKQTAKSIHIIASDASDNTINARIDYDLPHVTFTNSSSLSIEAIDTLHPSSYGGSDYSNLGISIINNKIPASRVCSASYYEVLRQHLDRLDLSYDD